MRISIVRSGGFFGAPMPAKVVDTDDEEIKELVREAVLVPAEQSDGSSVVDGFTYDITIEENGETRTIKTRDGDSNLNAQKLIDRCLD